MARRVLTIHEETGTGATRAIKFCLTPIAPTLLDGEGNEVAAGVTLSPVLDAVIGEDQIIDTLPMSGTATVMLPPESDTVADADGTGLRWRLTFGADAETIETPHITFGMPDNDVRLEDILPMAALSVGTVTGWVVSATAPTAPTEGLGWYDTSVSPKVLKIWDGTAWVASAAGGGGGPLADDSVTAAKARASTNEWKAEWRSRIHASRVSVGRSLPTAAATDLHIFNADVAAGLDWYDADTTTPLTSAAEGDMAYFLGVFFQRWIKVGNISDDPALVKALNADVDAETDDTKFMTVAKTFRAIARRVKVASRTVVGQTAFARNSDVDAADGTSSDDDTRALTVASAWRLITGRLDTASAATPEGVGPVSGRDAGDSELLARHDHVHGLDLIAEDLTFDVQERLGLSQSVKDSIDAGGTITVGDGLEGTGASDNAVIPVLKDGDLNIGNIAPAGQTPRGAIQLDPTFRAAALEQAPTAVTALPAGAPTGFYNLTQDHHVPATEQRFVLDAAYSGLYYGTSRASFGSVPPALGTAADLPAASGLAAVWFQRVSNQPNTDGTIRILMRSDLGAPSVIHLATGLARGDHILLALTATGVEVVNDGVTYTRYTTGLLSANDSWGVQKWEAILNDDDRVYVGIAFGDEPNRQYLNRDGTKADPTNTLAGLYYRTPAGEYELVQLGPPGDPVNGGKGPEWARWNINPAAANSAAGIGGAATQVGSPLTISGASHLVLPVQGERVIGLMLESYIGAALHQRITAPISDGDITIETGPDRPATINIVDLLGSTNKRLAINPQTSTTAAAAATVRIYPIFGGVGADGAPGDDGPTGPRGPAPDLTFVQVGSNSLSTVPGVTSSALALPNPAARRQLSAIHPVRFTGLANGYNNANGTLTLPAGVWDIKTTIDYVVGYGSDGQQWVDVYTYLYIDGAQFAVQVSSGENGTDPDMAHNMSVHVQSDDSFTVQVLANWQYNRNQIAGAGVSIQAGRLSAARLATADAETVQGGSGTSPDGTPRPYQVVLYGRFADAGLTAGAPPRPNIVILSDGPSVAPGVWHLDPSDATGDDPLWRAETRAFFHNGAWGNGVFAYSRVNPADGAFQYASDATGTGASEEQFAGWTHYRIREEDGTLGDWLPRSGNPSRDSSIWALLTNFAAGTWATEAVRNLDDFRDLYCTWGQYTAGYAERSFFRASDRFPASGIRSITAAEADAQLLRDGRVLRCQITPTRSGLYLRNEYPTGATESVGCDLAFIFVRVAAGLTDRQFDQIRLAAGSAGAGRIDVWGRT